MTVICFGDSNTFGYDPRSYLGGRYAPEARWVDILAQKTGWEVRNNGMNGRKIPLREEIFSKSADLLIVMLGTNDLLCGSSPEEAAGRMERFLNRLTMDREKILLIAPPPMQRGEWVEDQKLIDSSRALTAEYETLAKHIGIHFADAGTWGVAIAHDGVHFTEEGHKAFAEGLRQYLCAEIQQ